ncbi:glycosyltransferase family 4 protein [Maribacter aurantiacus]|uniref:Glycosyltransferase family 4 protein n=1 Tax=Maribacter aurantiacus TaxID=1882343 RepID=A0A5R8M4Y6_9FLAO|nr:glycosyltransferase family 4 protein [Maribacter aurantiacus]TLF44550.1 glycosyltransferase family 4 protein [Maribacter aurantiacus]
MKISFIIYGLRSGGAERAVSGLANYWVKNHEVSIITMVQSESFYPLNPNIKTNYCLTYSKSSTNQFSSIKDALKRIKILISHLNREKPDVVISFMTQTNIYAVWACKWLNIPCLVSERANHELNPLPRFQEILRDFSYSFCKGLVVQTSGNKKYYSKKTKSEKIKIIPNAVGKGFHRIMSELDKSGENQILNVGAFRNGKAQDILLRAFAKIDTSGWKLVFLGEGPNMEKYKALSKELAIEDKVCFKGAQKDVASYYKKASLFVFTSEHEGFPNALLEALYFGLPCISTNCPHGPADMITDGENGFLVPVGDVDTLATKMEELMHSDVLQKRFRENAIRSTQKYEMEPIAKNWMEVIQNAIS